ncbi:MAG: hypothetical protein Ta2G_04640 [Termitinemataceae bacterium]|nr:MAG: hypothetical protein Ta2G_04640 [Termitinemataceae bacterium]
MLEPENAIIVLEQGIQEKMENVVYVAEMESVLLVEVQVYIDVWLYHGQFIKGTSKNL